MNFVISLDDKIITEAKPVKVNKGSPWTDEKIAELKQLWADGASGSEIAAKLGSGLTRNAVIGRANRMGLDSRKRPPAVARVRSPRRVGNNNLVLRLHRTAPVRFDVPAFVPDPTAKIQFIDLENHHCRFPLWEDGASTDAQFYCGSPHADVVDGRSYCPHHDTISHTKPIRDLGSIRAHFKNSRYYG